MTEPAGSRFLTEITWAGVVAEAQAALAAAGVSEPQVSATWIAKQATGTDSTEWLEVQNQHPTERQLAAFDAMVARRRSGEPLQYVVGAWGFRHLDLFIDRRVLIPRPETETVAEMALAELDRMAAAGTVGPIVDLGTGSGAIGLSMAFERPGTEVWLTDASAQALQVAMANLAGIGRAGGSVMLVEGSWFEALPQSLAGSISVVVANPPYVADIADLEAQVAEWEPLSALLAEDAGTADLAHIINTSPSWLTRGGALVLEMAPDHVPPMAALASDRFDQVEAFSDLAGRSRGIVARRS